MKTQKFILLDIDGVMVPASGWKPVELDADGFYQFNRNAQKNLEWLLEKTGATIVLTTSHRTRYNSNEWKALLARRFATVKRVQTLDDAFKCANVLSNNPQHPPVNSGRMKILLTHSRLGDVMQWANAYHHFNYVILDDDTSLDALPVPVKRHWVKTFPGIGLNAEAAEKALSILTASA